MKIFFWLLFVQLTDKPTKAAQTKVNINRIEMAGMLPSVFESESIPVSDIWKTSVTFERGNYYRVEAASGGGKSSLCAYLYGLRDDYSGTLLFDSVNVTSLSMGEWQEIRRRHLAFLPQELGLFAELTAFENIELKNSLTGWKTRREIEEMLEILGLSSRKNYPAGRLSVGQRQRVAIIRALCQPFDFLLLDEPVSHLDDANNLLVAGMVVEEAVRQGAGIIATSVGNPIRIADSLTLKL